MNLLRVHIIFLILFASLPRAVHGQSTMQSGWVLRIYEDNDFMNIYGHGTDRRYTAGTRGDVFYLRRKESASIFYKLSVKPGHSFIPTFSWGLMQVMITPSNLRVRGLQPRDYPYSGALFAEHSIHFSNPALRLNVETDWIAGVMGPPSLTRQTQMLVHNIADFQKPQGWRYQLPADLLLNYDVTAEKSLLDNGHWWDVGVRSSIYAGSMLDGFSIAGQLHLGEPTRQFTGRMRQMLAGTRKYMFSASLSPGVDIIFYNALLDGGLFNPKSPVRDAHEKYSTLHDEWIKPRFDLQLLLASRRMGISFTQKTLSSDYKGLSGQNIGNVSVYLRFGQ